MNLSDLDPAFIKDGGEHPRGGRVRERVDTMDEHVVAVSFSCPVCHANGWDPCGPFTLPWRGRPGVDPARPSWNMSGTGLHDLTIDPSIKRAGYEKRDRAQVGEGQPLLVRREATPHAHFYVQSGRIESCGDDGHPYITKDGMAVQTPDGVAGTVPAPRPEPPPQPKEADTMSMTRKTYNGTSGPIYAGDEVGPDIIGAGTVSGTGFAIAWQDGPRGHDEHGNLLPGTGAQVEDVLAACHHRLEQFRDRAHDTEFNGLARDLISGAVKALQLRRSDRSTRGVEGTHSV